MPFVVSVRVMSVYETDASCLLCPLGHVKSDPGVGAGAVSELVIDPFLPELKLPVAPTGPLTLVLFEALGFLPPLFTQTYVAVALALALYSTSALVAQACFLPRHDQGPVAVHTRTCVDEMRAVCECDARRCGE
jgi:hypothetical protein